MSYDTEPASDREAMGMSYNEWSEYQNELRRMRANARANIKSASRNALAVQMIKSGRGPTARTPRAAPAPAPPRRTEQDIISEILGKHMFSNTNKAAVQAELSAALKAFRESQRAPPLGGAGAAPAPIENTSTFSRIPNEVRNRIASYISGETGSMRTHLHPLKQKIQAATSKLSRARKHKTRRRRAAGLN